MSHLGKLVDSASAVLFDFFHTLSSIETTNDTLPPESWQIMGLDRQAWRREWNRITPARLKGRITDPYELLSVPAKAAAPDVDEQLIDAAVQARLGKFANAVLRIDESVMRSLQVLRDRGKRLGLVSNADAIEIASWGQSPLREAFDAVLFSCEVGLVEPDKAIYLRACNELGVRPSECLFVGDGGSDELKGAKALGMTAVQVTGIRARLWPETVEESGRHADCCIDSIAALTEEA